MTHPYQIIDTTLREGEQTPGVRFDRQAKKAIIDHLVMVGVDEVELGIASRFYPCSGPLIRYCRRHHPQLKVSLWSRCNDDDLRHGLELEPDIMSLSIPVSDIHLTSRLGKDRAWAMATMTAGIQTVHHSRMTAAIGFEDATRAHPDFLIQMAQTAASLGVSRIRLADTVGIASPQQLAGLVETLQRHVTTPLAVHTHNDFGMATANGIAALEAGAQYVDTVVLGLGERCGCARLEEVAGYLSLIHGIKGLHPEYLKPLASLVSRLAARPIAANQPLVGEDIFACESGLHVHGVQLEPRSYEPYAPEKVQAKRKLFFGDKSGRRALTTHMQALAPGRKPQIDDTLLTTIRLKSQQLRRPLSDCELLETIGLQ